MKLFRGQAQHVWESRLVGQGWPEDAARNMAYFLVVGGMPPRWSTITQSRDEKWYTTGQPMPSEADDGWAK